MLIGHSPAMLQLIKVVTKVAKTDANILITGENGTGKEMFAQSIIMTASAGGCPLWLLIVLLFRNSFWKASCSVMYRGLLQERTGTERRDFLSWPTKEPFFWTKSERFHCRCRRNYCGFFRRGRLCGRGDSVIPVDIRILAATNQNLEQLAAERQFREDLLYRLDVLRINIPSLNQRREDISLLADSYMNARFLIYGLQMKQKHT